MNVARERVDLSLNPRHATPFGTPAAGTPERRAGRGVASLGGAPPQPAAQAAVQGTDLTPRRGEIIAEPPHYGRTHPLATCVRCPPGDRHRRSGRPFKGLQPLVPGAVSRHPGRGAAPRPAKAGPPRPSTARGRLPEALPAFRHGGTSDSPFSRDIYAVGVRPMTARGAANEKGRPHNAGGLWIISAYHTAYASV